MNKYEAMFIIKPDLSEEDRKNVFAQLGEAVTKHGGAVINGALWAEKRKFFFPIKKQTEGIYYLLSFTISPAAIKEIPRIYKLNENVLRVLINRIG